MHYNFQSYRKKCVIQDFIIKFNGNIIIYNGKNACYSQITNSLYVQYFVYINSSRSFLVEFIITEGWLANQKQIILTNNNDKNSNIKWKIKTYIYIKLALYSGIISWIFWFTGDIIYLCDHYCRKLKTILSKKRAILSIQSPNKNLPDCLS